MSSLEARQGSPDVFPISQEGPPEDSSASSLEQEWLRLGDSMQAVEKEEAFRLVARSLTVIVSTSPSPQHCDAQLLCEVLSSLQANEALRHCRKLLLFDAQPCAGHQEEAEKGGQLAAEGRSWVPSASSEGGEGAALAEAYRCYQNELQTAAQRGDPAMQGVELIFLQEWGHLVGTVRRALDSLSTPFVLLHQHDLVLSREMSASLVVEALKALASRDANCILLNRDVNFAGRSTEYLQAALHRPELWRSFARQHRLSDPQSALVLTPFVGYSDQTQLARADWLRNRVLRMVGKLKCCMEFAVHEIMIRAWLHDPAGRWERTYLMGGMEDGPFVFDCQKNGSCWADEGDSYSSDKEDEVFVPPSSRLRHRSQPNRCLSLYIYEWPKPGRPGRVLHYPDVAALENARSRELFHFDDR
ncbi:unnamed protein product [Polarella glacialis]|uniref:Uncharacterized protein n=1 Tax=Polarella glacialis TaxID=89957 RepID=A0A813KJW8_POLGL|nr:unnamed protein product [Polarella glacialis]